MGDDQVGRVSSEQSAFGADQTLSLNLTSTHEVAEISLVISKFNFQHVFNHVTNRSLWFRSDRAGEVTSTTTVHPLSVYSEGYPHPAALFALRTRPCRTFLSNSPRRHDYTHSIVSLLFILSLSHQLVDFSRRRSSHPPPLHDFHFGEMAAANRLSALALPPLPQFHLPRLPPIADPTLSQTTVTHSSVHQAARNPQSLDLGPATRPDDYEKLEHVGDGILGALVTLLLQDLYPQLPPGTATVRNAFLHPSLAP